MAWARSREPVFAKMRFTCVLTVASLTNRVREISRFDCPSAMSRRTSASRGVRSSPGAGRVGETVVDLAGEPGPLGERGGLRLGLPGAAFGVQRALGLLGPQHVR